MSTADLLRYPDASVLEQARSVPDFYAEIAHVSLEGMQELYTTTFDLNPVATLEVGWHLWGEHYERGRFLADLRALQEQLGIEDRGELPDHLTVLLPTIAKAPSAELIEQCVKAIDKILVPLEEHGNPYRHLLRAARAAICHPERSEGPGRQCGAPPEPPGPSLTLGMTQGGAAS